MSKSAAIKTLLLGVFFSFLGAGVWGQEVLYGPETFGDGSSINAGLGTWSAAGGVSWTASTNLPSSGYTGASGSGNLRALIGDGSSRMLLKPSTTVSTINYTSIKLKVAIRCTADDIVTARVTYGDGSILKDNSANIYNNSDNGSWQYVEVDLTNASNFNDLWIRFELNVGFALSGSFYIDDIIVEGIASTSTDYYNVGTDLSLNTNWNTDPGGTGSQPLSFSDPNNIYNVVNTGNIINSNWTISGTNSQVIINSGADFTIPSANTYSGNAIEVEDNATLSVENTTIPVLTNLGTSSTINFSGGDQSIPSYSYGNVEISGTGTKSIALSTTIAGNLVLTSGILELIQTDDQTVTINGNITRTGGALSGSTNSNLTLGGSANVSDLYFSDDTNLRNLTINKSSATVNLQSDLVVNNTLTLQAGIFNINSGSLTIQSGFSGTGLLAGTSSSNLTINGTGDASLTFASGSQLLNNLTINRASSTITMASDLEVAGTLTLTDGTFAVGNYNLRLSGNPISGTPTNLSTSASSNLLFSGSASSVFIPSSVSQLNNLTLNNSNGLLQNSASLTVNGTMTLTSGVLDIQSNELILLSDPSLSSGTLNASAGTVYYNQPSNNQNIIAGTYANLEMNDYIKQFPNSLVNISGTFTPGTASHNMQQGEVEFSSSSAQTVPNLAYHDLTFSSTGNRNMSSATISGDFITNSNPVTISGTIDYNGTTSQTIAALDYQDLIISGNKNNGTITLAPGNINVSGAFTNSASSINSYITTSNTFIYDGDGSQTITPFNYNNLTITGSRTDATITLGSGIVRLAGDFTNNATGITGYSVTWNTFEYNGTATQTVAALEYNNLTINNSAGCILTGDITVNNSLALTLGDLNIDTHTLRLLNGTTLGSGSIASSNTGTVEFAQSSDGQTILLGSYGNLTTEGGAKNFSEGTVSISNTFMAGASDHSFSASGAGSTINFNGEGATQAVPSLNYFNLSLTNGGTYNFSGTIGIAGNFSTTGGTYNTGGSTFNFNGSGNQNIAGIEYDNLTVTDRNGTVTLVGTLSISGVFSAAAATTVYDPATSLVNFNGTVAQNIPDIDFYNLTISNSAGVALTSDIVVDRNLNLSSGNLTIGDNSLTVNDNITYGSGNLVGNLSGAILNLNGIASTTLRTLNLYQLNIDRPGHTIDLSGNLSIANQLQISNGTLSVGSNNLSIANSLINNGTFNTGTGTVTFTAATVISGTNNITFNNVATSGTLSSITGTNSPIYVTGNWTNNSIDDATIGVEVYFNGTTAQSITANNSSPSVQSFGNVYFENSSAKTLGSSFNVDGNLNLVAGTFETAGFNINLAGNWNNTGTTFTAGSNTVILDGDAGQTISSNAQPFNNLILTPAGSESVALSDNLDVNGNFTINDGTAFATNDNNINVAGNWQFNSSTLESTFAAGTDTVYFDGADQNIAMPVESFFAVVMQGSGTKTLNTNFSAGSNISVESGATFSTNNFIASIQGDLTNDGTVNIGSGALDVNGNLDNSGSMATNADITVAGNWNNSGTFTPNTFQVTLDGASTQTITGGNFYDLSMSGSGSRILLSALDVNNDLTIGTGISFANYDGSANWFDINLAGDWINNGSFTATGGTLFTDGSTLQEIRGASASTFYDLTTTNVSADGVRVEGNVDLVNTLKLQANTNFDADGAGGTGVMRLLSNSSRTARVAKVESGATLEGDLTTAHTLVKSSVGWYYLGTPVKGQTVQDWMDDMLIQGVDTRLPGSYTNIRLYDEATGTWTALTSASDFINPGQGIRVTLFSSNFSSGSMTYDNRGLPVVGDNNDQRNTGGTEAFDFSLSYTSGGGGDEGAGWNLIANPYPSELSLNAANWTFNNVNSFAYIWDGENFTYTTVNMNTTSSSIASGQGFFVQAVGSSPSLSINEDAKNSSNPTFFRKTVPENELYVFASNEDGRKDVAFIQFMESATNEFDLHMDATKLDGGMFNIATLTKNNKSLVYNSLPLLSQDDSIKIKFSGVKGKYHLTFDKLNSFENKVAIYLKDKFLNQKIPVTESLRYEFSVTDNPSSQGEDRFELVFIRNFINLAGNVNDHNQDALNNVDLIIKDQHQQTITTTTNIAGKYGVELERGKQYEVYSKYNELNSVSFADIMAVQLHLKKKMNLSSAFARISADVNLDTEINGADVNEMKRKYTERIQEFEEGNWIVINEGIFDQESIWPLPTKAYINSSADQVINFLAIPLGNVSGLNKEVLFNQSSEQVKIILEPHFAFKGDVLNLPVQVNNLNDTYGFHFKLRWDPEKVMYLEHNQLLPGVEVITNRVEDGLLQIICLDELGNSISSNKLLQLFNLRFTVIGDHNEEIIFSIADSQEAFAINHNLEKDAITLAANSVVIGEENTKLKLMQNYPNPAEKDTRIIFSIPNAGKVKLVVSDLNGKVVKVDEGDFQSGINYFDLNTFKMKSGAYIYRIELEGNVKSRKMIIK